MIPDILANKLLRCSIDPSGIKFAVSFLTNRKQSLTYHGCHSDSLTTRIAIPRSTIGRPQLWKIYVSDFTPTDNTIKYVDDTTLFTTITKKETVVDCIASRECQMTLPNNEIQTAANNIHVWCENNHQIINASKTQHMVFLPQLNICPINSYQSQR